MKISKKIDPMRTDFVIYNCLETVRIIAILLQPIIPQSADSILNQLAVNKAERTINYAKYGRKGPINLPEYAGVLFKKYSSMWMSVF